MYVKNTKSKQTVKFWTTIQYRGDSTVVAKGMDREPVGRGHYGGRGSNTSRMVAC